MDYSKKYLKNHYAKDSFDWKNALLDFGKALLLLIGVGVFALLLVGLGS